MVEPAPHPVCTVVIVAYNSGAFLQACVNALARQDLAAFEAVIADNASTDGSVDDLVLPDARFRIRRMGANLGFAAANNRVAEASTAEFIVLLNPDTEAEPGWLSALVASARTDTRIASVGSLQVRLDDSERLDGVGDVWHAAGLVWRAGDGLPRAEAPISGPIFGACAAAALYRRDVFLSLGGFDERFFCYCEDVDLAFRFRLAGFEAVRASDAVVRHAGSGVTGRQSAFSRFHGQRNRIWTFLKNTPGLWFWALLPAHLAYNAWYLLRAWRGGYLPVMLEAYRAAWSGRGPFLEDRRRLRPKSGFIPVLKMMSATPWGPLSREIRPRPPVDPKVI